MRRGGRREAGHTEPRGASLLRLSLQPPGATTPPGPRPAPYQGCRQHQGRPSGRGCPAERVCGSVARFAPGTAPLRSLPPGWGTRRKKGSQGGSSASAQAARSDGVRHGGGGQSHAGTGHTVQKIVCHIYLFLLKI